MKKSTNILMAAVMSMSLAGAAWAQSPTGGSTSGSGSTGSSATGGSGASGTSGASGAATPGSAGGSSTGPGATGSGSTGASGSTGTSSTGMDASGASGSDAMGSSSASQTRSMQGGSQADQQMSQQLDKIAGMPDQAPDALFVLEAATGNLYEIEFARIAQQKSQDPQVKQLAQMMEKDHKQANEQLKPIAQKMGVELPTSLTSQKQKMLQVKQALSSEDFDTCYLLDNKASHAKSITSFADHQKSVKNEDLRNYVVMVLPKLQQHGQHVQQAAASKGFSTPLGGSGSGGGAHGSMSDDTSRSMTGAGTSGSTSDPMKPAGSGTPSDATDPANNQNPSNR